MSLIDDLKSDITEALRSKKTHKVETLRGLVASIHNEEIAKHSKDGGRGELSEDEIITVLQREAKKRKESAEVYGKARRDDLESKEKKELVMIESYLPPALEEAYIEEIVKKVVSDGGDNFGKVMGAVMKEIAGRADSRLVTEIVKKHLGDGE